MRKRAAISLVFLLFPFLASGGEIKGRCYVTFFGTSTLHDFTGTVRSRPFTVLFEKGADGNTVIRSATVDVPVDEIDTDKRKRDRQLRKMFQSETYPHIQGKMENIRPAALRHEMERSETKETTRDLTLRIRDVERVIPVRIGNYRQYTQQISFDMEFAVSLEDYGLDPPAPLFGLIRVDDIVDVKITFDLEVEPAELFRHESRRQEGAIDAGGTTYH